MLKMLLLKIKCYEENPRITLFAGGGGGVIPPPTPLSQLDSLSPRTLLPWIHHCLLLEISCGGDYKFYLKVVRKIKSRFQRPDSERE